MKSGRIMKGACLFLVIVLIIVLSSCASTDFKRIHKDITEVENPETEEVETSSAEIVEIIRESAEDIPDEESLTPLYVDGTLLPKDSEASPAVSEKKAETKTDATFVKSEGNTEEKMEISAADTEADPVFGFSSFSTLDLILLSLCGVFLVVIIILVVVIARRNSKIRRGRMRRRTEHVRRTGSAHVIPEEPHDAPLKEKPSEKAVDIPETESAAENKPSDTPEETDLEFQDNAEETDEKKEPEAGEPTVNQSPVNEAHVEQVSIEEIPADETPVEETPVEETPVEETPVEEAPVEETPVEEAPVEEAPVEEAPVEEAPVEEAPVEEAPVEEAPVEETPVGETPVEETSENGGAEDEVPSGDVTAEESVSSEPLPEGGRGEAVAVLDSLLQNERKEEAADGSRSKPTLEEILGMLKE